MLGSHHIVQAKAVICFQAARTVVLVLLLLPVLCRYLRRPSYQLDLKLWPGAGRTGHPVVRNSTRRAVPMQSQRRKVDQASREPNRISQIDRNVSLALYKNVGMRIPRRVVMALEHTGSGVLWLPLVPTLWYFSSNSAFRVVMANLFVGLWIDIVYVGVLKGIFRRKRPIYNHKGDFVVIVAVDQFSFPSGHAAR